MNDRRLRITVAIDTAIVPALALLPKHMDSSKARVMLVAIGLQESALRHRYQVLNGGGKGPGRGLWQFEQNGVLGVLRHALSAEPMRELCHQRDVSMDPRAIWGRLEDDDVLAAGVARLLLWTDRSPLPAVDDERGAWHYYTRNWRPGKPHPDRWPPNHADAVAEVIGAEA